MELSNAQPPTKATGGEAACQERLSSPGPCAPFIALGLKTLSRAETEEAISCSRAASESYDPVTQTSVFPAYAGTSKTYTGTTSWKPGPITDDSRVDDH